MHQSKFSGQIYIFTFWKALPLQYKFSLLNFLFKKKKYIKKVIYKEYLSFWWLNICIQF